MRRSPRLAGAEVIDWRQLMPGVFNPDMTHKAALGHDVPKMSCRSQIPDSRGRAVTMPFERRCEVVEVWAAWSAAQMSQHLR